MRYAPIVMFVYNRADHFEKTVNALSKCEEAKDSNLYIFSDGPKNSETEKQVNEVRKLAYEIKDTNLFKQTFVIESESNKGLAASVTYGVSKVISKFGKVIVLEDDCVCSPYLLNFMNKSLNFFQENKKIGCIAGYTPTLNFPDNYNDDIFVAYRSCSCCWATWKDRWDNVDWDLKNIKSIYRNKNIIKKLNSNGSDRLIRLYRQTVSNRNSWSVKFGTHLVVNDMMTVYPKYSYIFNIGCDNTGVHSRADDAEKIRIDLSKAIANPVIIDVEIDHRIQKSLKKFYSGGFISDIKRFLYTKAIVFKNK